MVSLGLMPGFNEYGVGVQNMFYCVDLTWFIAVISVFYFSVWACGVPHRASLGGTGRRTASAKCRRGQRSATDTAADVAGWTASSCTTTTTRLLVLHRSTDNARHAIFIQLLPNDGDDSIVFGIVAKCLFHCCHDNSWTAAWWYFARTCILTTSRSLFNIKVKVTCFCFFLCVCPWYYKPADST